MRVHDAKLLVCCHVVARVVSRPLLGGLINK